MGALWRDDDNDQISPTQVYIVKVVKAKRTKAIYS